MDAQHAKFRGQHPSKALLNRLKANDKPLLLEGGFEPIEQHLTEPSLQGGQGNSGGLGLGKDAHAHGGDGASGPDRASASGESGEFVGSRGCEDGDNVGGGDAHYDEDCMGRNDHDRSSSNSGPQIVGESNALHVRVENRGMHSQTMCVCARACVCVWVGGCMCGWVCVCV